MIDTKIIDDMAKALNDAIPASVKDLENDLQAKFHAILQSTLAKLDLVTREEFDVQTNVLARTRKKLEALEKKVAKLEK